MKREIFVIAPTDADTEDGVRMSGACNEAGPLNPCTGGGGEEEGLVAEWCFSSCKEQFYSGSPNPVLRRYTL
ncbi:hypothetical protein DPMN_120622 [Dreissena polymorpha]|uniref:Uncharacterized protein n=1 Tax=Dreissena polymorpha TaxID=45954 RepID=A0A9D4GNW2_DREPO|nr:hypothetical protein DPMN_120622 [Dreissena polymorpha]